MINICLQKQNVILQTHFSWSIGVVLTSADGAAVLSLDDVTFPHFRSLVIVLWSL